jgi:hypothetical protein
MKTMNHSNYIKILKNKSIESLKFIIKDCREAIESMPDNPNNSYYADEINYCCMELNKRK